MKYLNKEIIEKNIDMRDVIEAVKSAFVMTEERKIDVPLRTVIPAEKGSLLFMPAYSAELGRAALKNVNVFPENAELGLPATLGEIMLIDASTGVMLAMLDGTYVTQLRTGAASGAAFDVLARKDCRKGALIGTGSQAEAQLDAMLEARSLEEVHIYSLNTERCKAFVDRMREKHKEVSIVMGDNADSCIEDADLIIAVTTSSEPVFDGSLVKKGATVSCVGTYEPHKHEIDMALIARADKIYCDNVRAVLSESGDILIPVSQKIISEEDICGGLGEVISGSICGRENDEEIIVFETVGIAAQDLLAASMIYDRIKEAQNE